MPEFQQTLIILDADVPAKDEYRKKSPQAREAWICMSRSLALAIFSASVYYKIALCLEGEEYITAWPPESGATSCKVLPVQVMEGRPGVDASGRVKAKESPCKREDWWYHGSMLSSSYG